MFKTELTEEQKAHAEQRDAEEKVSEYTREEVHRKKWCIEHACMLEETRQENLLVLAEKIYSYVWGAR